MKQGWEIKKLGEVCDLQNGFAFKSTDYIEFSNTVNFRMSQIRPGGGVDLENNPKYLPDEYAITYKDYLLKEGDIVIAMTDMATETKILGVPTIVPSDSRNWLLNQRVGKLFNIDKSKVNIAFLKYILVSEPINEYYKKLGRGGLQINIGKQDILNAKIPLPPLPEQQRIVSILDEAFAAIAKAKANAEQNLKNAKELFESYLQGVLKKKVKVGKNNFWKIVSK
jgi:type I restriction enzyme S subunit